MTSGFCGDYVRQHEIGDLKEMEHAMRSAISRRFPNLTAIGRAKGCIAGRDSDQTEQGADRIKLGRVLINRDW
jgi:hypothetical protein